MAACGELRTAAGIQSADASQLASTTLLELFRPALAAEMIAIDDFASTTSGATPARHRKSYWAPPRYPWIKTGEINYKPITVAEECVSELAFQECSLQLLPVGTVLIAMYGQGKTRGQSAVLEIEGTTNQACFAILPNANFDPYYLQLWLRLSYGALRAISNSRGGNQANLSGEVLKAFKVPLLSMPTQKSIAKQGEEILSKVDQLNSALRIRTQEIDLLPKRFLARAFEGER